ncbi:MAG: small multi-drug export [Dehalococcoidia bacterium]|nr:MAG: small multi-drug export [Dehalococcoidia bacterium]
MSPEELLSLGFSRELVVIIIAALPIFELRGALPVAINLFRFPWYYALLLAIIGNLLPVPFILLFLDAISRRLGKIAILDRFFGWLFARARRQGGIAKRYERIGLALFVAVPLPVTGAWTGSLVAVLFGLKFGHAFLSIFIGVFIAGVIVTCLSLLGWVGAVIAGVGLSLLAILSLWRASR